MKDSNETKQIRTEIFDNDLFISIFSAGNLKNIPM